MLPTEEATQCAPDGQTDFMEYAFEQLCRRFKIKFERHDHKSGLDFYLPDYDVYVEVKQFHSDRIAGQMSRKENVIAIQGRRSLAALSAIFEGLKNA